MRPLRRLIALLCLPLLLAAESSRLDPEEVVRQANAAFERQEYEAAVKLYEKAEATIPNPGLVAFNKGAALYRMADYRKAQEHYRRCLDEADAPRRAALLYNLGNCLLQRAQAGGDLALFQEALQSYASCLQQPGCDEDLRDRARHNLELTKLLWLQARKDRPNPQENENGSENKPEPPRPEKGPSEQEPGKEEGGDPQAGARKPILERKARPDSKKGNDKAQETNEQMPGKGTIPPPPDADKLKPLSPPDALHNLDVAADRIRDERLQYRRRAAPAPARGVQDW